MEKSEACKQKEAVQQFELKKELRDPEERETLKEREETWKKRRAKRKGWKQREE